METPIVDADPDYWEAVYTPDPLDDLIGISVQGTGGGVGVAESRVIERTFRVHPVDTQSDNLGGVTNQADGDAGGQGSLGQIDSDGDGVPDTASDIGYEIPAGSIIDPNPDDDQPVPTVFDVFIGAETTDEANIASEVVEVTILDALGQDLTDTLGGDIVQDDSPIIITMNYDPEKLDLTNFTIFYRERNPDGS